MKYSSIYQLDENASAWGREKAELLAQLGETEQLVRILSDVPL